MYTMDFLSEINNLISYLIIHLSDLVHTHIMLLPYYNRLEYCLGKVPITFESGFTIAKQANDRDNN